MASSFKLAPEGCLLCSDPNNLCDRERVAPVGFKAGHSRRSTVEARSTQLPAIYYSLPYLIFVNSINSGASVKKLTERNFFTINSKRTPDSTFLHSVLFHKECVILHTVCHFTHSVQFDSQCVNLHTVCNFPQSVILLTVCNFTHSVLFYTLCNFTRTV